MTIVTDDPKHFAGSAELLEAQTVRGKNCLGEDAVIGWVVYMPFGQRSYLAYSFRNYRGHGFNDRSLAIEWVKRA